MSPEQRRLRAQLAANSRWAREPDRAKQTQAGRAAALAKYEAEVDPDGLLTPQERARRAQQMQRAHMQRIALKRSRGGAA